MITAASHHTTKARVPEELYVREGMKLIAGERVMVYVAPKGTRCDHCEFPLDRDRKHPAVEGQEDLRHACGGYVVRLVGR